MTEAKRKPACYALALGDCHGKLNGEHVGSESILRDIVSSGSNTVAVDGRPWQRRPRQPVGIGRLKAKILCEKHNGALPRFDTAMRDLGQAVTETIARLAEVRRASW